MVGCKVLEMTQHVHAHIHTHTVGYTYTHTHTVGYTYTHTQWDTHTHTHSGTHIYTHTVGYTYTHTHKHTGTHTHTQMISSATKGLTNTAVTGSCCSGGLGDEIYRTHHAGYLISWALVTIVAPLTWVANIGVQIQLCASWTISWKCKQ